jgi:type IV secretory pathway VirJ component
VRSWLRLAVSALLLGGLGACASLGVGPRQGWEPAPLWAEPSHGPPKALAVWYSGDGGWGRADRRIVPRLAAQGLAVVDINSRRYFWRARTLEEAAQDLDRVIDRYSRLWGVKDLVLVGYSFGGGAVPLIAPHLSPEHLERLKAVVLLSPISKGQLVIRPWTWLGIMQPGAVPTAELVKASPAPVACVVGAHDHIGVCPGDVPTVVADAGHTWKTGAAVAAETILKSAGLAP